MPLSNGVKKSGAFVDNVILRADGTGKRVQASGITIDDSNNVSGAISLSVGTTVSATGSLRVANNVTIIGARNAANSADLAILAVSSSDGLTVGNVSGSSTFVGGAQTIMQTSSGNIFVAATAVDWRMNFSSIRTNDWSMTINSKLEDSAVVVISMKGQNAFATATGTNLDGGHVLLYGGSRGSTAGRRGGVRLALNASATEIMLQVTDVQPEATSPSRLIALLRNAAITSTQMPTGTGDLVVYQGNCAVAPTVAPVSGGVYYEESGTFKHIGTSGTITTMAAA